MIEKIIAEHFAAGNKRVVIPGFGALIRRDGREVVFMELLNSGDDSLLQEVANDEGITTEAAGDAVRQFVERAKGELRAGNNVTIEGLGFFSANSQGKTAFTYTSGTPNEKASYATPIAAISELSDKASIPQTVFPDTVPAQGSFNEGAVEEKPFKPTIQIQQRHKKRKTDSVLIIAIIAIVLVVALLVYGYVVEKQFAPVIDSEPEGVVLVEAP